MESNVKDLREYRRKKRRKKRIIKFFISLIILGTAFCIYLMRDNWIPYFEDLVDDIKFEVLEKRNNKDTDFPIELSTSSDYDIKKIDDKIAILTDTYYNVFAPNGSICFSKQHGMSNAVMKTAGKRALIYDQGAYTFRVETKFKEVYTKKLDEKIMYATISNEGYVAIVTMSDKYSSFMTVFDNNGDEIFYCSSSKKIISVDFTSKSNGCIISTMMTKNAGINTMLTKYNFNSEKPVWQSEPVTTLGIDIKVTSDNGIILVGDSMSCFFSSNGEILNKYIYQSSLKGYSISQENLALWFSNVELRKECVIILRGDSENSAIDICTQVDSIYMKDKSLFIITQDKINKYSDTGNFLREIDFSGNYQKMIVIDNNAYMLGHEILEKIYVGA